MKKLLLTLFALVSIFSVSGQNFNRPVPNGLFAYEYTQNGGVQSGYVLSTLLKLNVPQQSPNYVSPYPVIFDKDGFVAWYSKPIVGVALDFKYLESMNSYVYTYVKQGAVNSLVMDDQFNAIDTLTTTAIQDVHDLQVADNGNWLITTAYYDTMDLSAYTFNGIQGSTQTIVKGFGYEEIDPTGNLIGSYNSNSNVHPTETLDFWGYNVGAYLLIEGKGVDQQSPGG